MFKEYQTDRRHEFEENESYQKSDRIKLEQIGLIPEDIEQLANPERGGASALVYFIEKKGQKLAVKKGAALDPNEKPSREYVILKLLTRREGKKISPRPYYYNDRNDILITEKIDGELIGDLDDENLKKVAAALSQLHQTEFHRFGLPFHGRQEGNQFNRLIQQMEFLDDWFEKMAPVIKQQEAELYSRLKEIKEAIWEKVKESEEKFQNKSFSLIHYDLNPGNILKDQTGNVIFLDWRQAAIGDRATDIAKFFYKNYLEEDQQKLFLNEYLKIINDPDIKQRSDIYYWVLSRRFYLLKTILVNMLNKFCPLLLNLNSASFKYR